jgi:hypothetical protein
MDGEAVMLEIVSDFSWKLSRVSVLTALTVPTGTLPKLSVDADVAVGLTPVPLSVMVCGLLGEVLVMVTVPAGCAPSVVGLRLMPMLQVAPTASVAPQGDTGEAGNPYGPPAVTVIEVMVTADEPVFLKAIEWVTPVVLTTRAPNPYEVLETVVCAWTTAEENRLNIAISENRNRFCDFRTKFIPRLDIRYPPGFQPAPRRWGIFFPGLPGRTDFLITPLYAPNSLQMNHGVLNKCSIWRVALFLYVEKQQIL